MQSNRSLAGPFDAGVKGKWNSEITTATTIESIKREGVPQFLLFVSATQEAIIRHTDKSTKVTESDIEDLRSACCMLRECALGASRKGYFAELRQGESPFLGRSNIFRLIELSQELREYMRESGLSPEEKLGKVIGVVERYIGSSPQNLSRRDCNGIPSEELAILNSVMHVLGGGYIVKYRSNLD